MKNLITTLLFILICTNAISQDQAVIKQPSYPEVESDLVIQIKDQGEEIQKLKEKNKILEEYIKNYFQRQDSIINESTSHFDSWLTYAAILISFLGIMATIFCAFSAWKIHLTEIDIRKQLKSQSRIVTSKVITLITKCNDVYANLNKRMTDLKDTGIEEIIDLIKEKDIQITKIFDQYASNKKRNIENDHEFKEEINKYIDNLKKTNPRGVHSYNDENLIYIGLKYYIDKKHKEACLYWEKVNEKYDKYAYVLMLWGNALLYCAISERRSELFKQSCEKYKSAIKLDNKDERFFNNWANALSEWAMVDKRVILYNESIEKFDLAVKISPASSYIYYNWALTLYNFAKSELVEQNMIPELYKQSCEKYKMSSQIDPLDVDTFCNWGVVLSEWAELNKDEKMFMESLEKYKKAAEINPMNNSLYSNWGSTILTLAQLKNELINHKEEIESFFLKAEEIKDSSASYNLACLYSLVDEKSHALNWLDKNLRFNPNPNKEKILSDPDLDNIKSDPRFKELMDKYFPK